MKSRVILIALLFVAASCGRKSEHSMHEHESESDNPNRALYDQVQEIHMDAMDKMKDFAELKSMLESKLKATGLTDEKKKELNEAHANLDSAEMAMDSWMGQWMKNAPDSADVEKGREYFESQLEAVRKVRDMGTEAIDRARTLAEEKN